MKVKKHWRNIKFSFLLSLTKLIYYLLFLYTKTLRFRMENIEHVFAYMERGPVILLNWHQRIFGGFLVPRRQGLAVPIMISQSRDGEFIASIVQHAGFIPVRGSSTRGGMKALRELIRVVKKHRIAIHIVDGPTGPPQIVKAGGISLAQLAGGFLCPVFVAYEKYWVFNSWDRFMIPKPFSTVVMRFDDHFEEVSHDLEDKEFEELRKKIEERMIQGYKIMDDYPFS
ncbi:MAG: lysophospholipid acyltransferase family protein [Syntrophobacterales bacterium]|jgi:lysophospholipid acyltransferase (LPLAT)-like uncharacterized protein|nr:lysophospholipid acyltransferase family protein [Syntrophobacterales bacterium]